MTETVPLTPLGHQILEHWRRHRPKMVENLERGNHLQTGDLRSAGVNGQPAVRADSGPEDGLPPGVGNRDEGMGVSPGRGGSAPVVVRSGDPRSTPAVAHDLRITSAHGIGEGGLKQKAQANLAAIRTLKTIEAENRPATPEEKAALVKYTGWGAMPNAFAPQPPPEWQSVAGRVEGSADRRGVCVGSGINSKCALYFSRSRSGNLAGDGAVRPAARRTHPRAVDGCRALLWSDAGKLVSRYKADRC